SRPFGGTRSRLTAFLFTHTRTHTPHYTKHYRLPPSSFMWQFLYFLPLPQGQGSLRPTFWPPLRIGSGFFFSPPVFVCLSAAAPCACRACVAEIAAACVARAPAHSAACASSSPISSMRKTASVVRSRTPSHILSNSFIPSRLYTIFGSSWA